MQKPQPQRKRPAYAVGAVDSALHLIELLRDAGAVRLTEAAAELGVSPSTAHRLMAMLVYRGFAVQDERRRYLPGPALGERPLTAGWTMRLRRIAQPHLEALAHELGESANLVVRAGSHVRFLTTVEGGNVLRVGDRQGAILPARFASAGKAILAELDRPVLDQLFRSPQAEAGGDAIPEQEFAAFLTELEGVRRNGFAANAESTEEGISAVGVAVRNGAGEVVAGLSIAVPAIRYRALVGSRMPGVLFAVRGRLELDLADFRIEDIPDSA
ncbi:IclR family transcriptional regulator [Diaminobutyricimonas sp. TR449]|uniref:IclR family transcriptional regulator n=1 Tax=Diaminobutyricimonas sp. TR449 TaxID=2708076 RepID=UPI00141E775D|nr:IclR family transcriptional regulator [Diaminobutyricimonas sp. TR449]